MYPDISLQTGASHQSHLEMVSSHRIVIEPIHIQNFFKEVFRPNRPSPSRTLIQGRFDNLKSQKLLDSELKYDDQAGFQIDDFI